MRIYNTLSRSIESFVPINPPHVGMYTCGPTVYDYQHIGHMRRYVGDDILVRILVLNGFRVKQVMNITDVGHLTSDADTGEDKMEKGAKKFGLSVWDIAKKFEKQFFDSTHALGIQKPALIMHATEYINEQIDLVKKLEAKGFTYKTSDGIYFDTSKLSHYGKLSTLDEIKEGARVEINSEKRNSRDFALWKFSPSESSGSSKRQMEWESPWGIGFPGWHLECSAMSMKALGESFDIHTGGIDHISIHHTNEIAQSEAATGKEFVKYWVHHAFLLVDGQKMSKSLGNIYTVQDIEKKGFAPYSLRYLYLQTHYRQEMNFTFQSLEAAGSALKKLQKEVLSWESPEDPIEEFDIAFLEAINDDMNMPKALAVMWELIKSDHPTSAKAASLQTMNTVLGLPLSFSEKEKKMKKEVIPEKIMKLLKQRDELRRQKSFFLADMLRKDIEKMGYVIVDNEGETTVKKQ